MPAEFYDNEGPPEDRAREGLFDAQLSFPVPLVGAPQAVATIVKRDGREVPFDEGKVAEAILRAADTVGDADEDRAASLASGVALYLSKVLEDGRPTVDQVHDAVERVLIEMGHVDTALAYVRHRDRQSRLEELREGEGEDSREEYGALVRRGEDATRQPSISVHASADTLTGWDRDRIARALVRETDMDEGLAKLIALEVEAQIRKAGVRTLTAPLIRELVDAKLLERGLEQHRKRHMRLGVPLYDAERLICGPNKEPSQGAQTPETTNQKLAERVKREYALSHVFSQEVSESHLQGDIHIHGLEAVDRLGGILHSPVWVARYGMGIATGQKFSEPPIHLHHIIGHLAGCTKSLQQYVAGPVGWDVPNVFLAPFLEDLTSDEVRDTAKMIVYEYTLRALGEGGWPVTPFLTVAWDVPDDLRDVDAIGQRGEYTGRTYGEYAYGAQQLAWALLETLREGGERGKPFPAPELHVVIPQEFFSSEGHEEFLKLAAETAARHGNIHFIFPRDKARADERNVWRPVQVIGHEITMNLPRAAYQAKSIQPFLEGAKKLLELIADAHREKRDFLTRLFQGGRLGPWSLLATKRDDESFMDMDRLAYLVGVTGLNECVQALTGEELHGPEEAAAMGLYILSTLEDHCEALGLRHDLKMVLSETNDDAVSRRFASMDLDREPDAARRLVKFNPTTEEIHYTPGAHLAPNEALSAMDRVRLEGEHHSRFGAHACTHVSLPDADMTGDTLAAFLKKAYFQTTARHIVIDRER